jgi:hypothetical protein
MTTETTPRSARFEEYIRNNRPASPQAAAAFDAFISNHAPTAVTSSVPANTANAIPAGSPWHDAAAPILSAAAGVPDGVLAEAWDAYHQSKHSNELVTKLAGLNLPDGIKHQLYQAKVDSTPPLTAVDKVFDAINRLGTLDPKVRDIAENHPTLLKSFLDQNTKE